jgi:hypothetical protein
MREHYEECLSTLQFANRCRSVQNQVGCVNDCRGRCDRQVTEFTRSLRSYQPRVNYINSSVVDKDRRIRKLQEEVSGLRRHLEGLKSEYNNRFVAALNELGFEAEEVTESGEIKFAVGCCHDLTNCFRSAGSNKSTPLNRIGRTGAPLCVRGRSRCSVVVEEFGGSGRATCSQDGRTGRTACAIYEAIKRSVVFLACTWSSLTAMIVSPLCYDP